MKTSKPAGLDMRAFAWPLLPLERKLGWESDACVARLAQALAALDASQRQVRAVEALRQEQTALAKSEVVPDAHTHRHLLQYLGSIELRLRHAAQQRRLREQDVAQAREHWNDCERRMQTLSAARDEAVRAHVRGATLRGDRQADAAWLMRQQQVQRQEGGAP